MEVINLSLEEQYHSKENLVACFGFFDGLHIAHQKLMYETLKLANKNQMKSAFITFYPNPNVVLNKMNTSTYLSPLEAKIEEVEKIGFDYFFVIKFDIDVLKMPKKVFVDTFLKPLKISSIVVGFDNRYGYLGEGSIHTLKADFDDCVEVKVIDALKYHGEKIGTSKILTYLKAGNIYDLNFMLGRYYQIRGRVIYGRGVGKVIGLPTANVSLNYPYTIPKNGVYLAEVLVKGIKKMAVLNIGYNPSFNLVESVSIEAHLLEFDDNIYGEEIEIRFIERIRDEKKFDSLEEFLAEVEINKNYALNYYHFNRDLKVFNTGVFLNETLILNYQLNLENKVEIQSFTSDEKLIRDGLLTIFNYFNQKLQGVKIIVDLEDEILKIAISLGFAVIDIETVNEKNILTIFKNN